MLVLEAQGTDPNVAAGGRHPAVPGTSFLHRLGALAVDDLSRLPRTIRLGLVILGYFGLADVIAHLGAPTASGLRPTDASQVVAHLGLLGGMVVVLVGVLRDAAVTAAGGRRTHSGRSGATPEGSSWAVASGTEATEGVPSPAQVRGARPPAWSPASRRRARSFGRGLGTGEGNPS